MIATFDADEAIRVLETVRGIELVITDINMPGSMDGLRLAAAIRDRWPPIHLILVTGLNPPKGSELPRGSQFLRKPYESARHSVSRGSFSVENFLAAGNWRPRRLSEQRA